MDNKQLADSFCESCRNNSLYVEPEKVKYLVQVLNQNWRIVSDSDIDRLLCEFNFENYKQALFFTQALGELAQQFQHHPVIITEYDKVTVLWWTHEMDGLHYNDFVMAAKTNILYFKNRS